MEDEAISIKPADQLCGCRKMIGSRSSRGHHVENTHKIHKTLRWYTSAVLLFFWCGAASIQLATRKHHQENATMLQTETFEEDGLLVNATLCSLLTTSLMVRLSVRNLWIPSSVLGRKVMWNCDCTMQVEHEFENIGGYLQDFHRWKVMTAKIGTSLRQISHSTTILCVEDAIQKSSDHLF